MLEVCNLTKIYKPKKGVPVKALDNISVKFPETGMVFLLGKSGCGKSTFLNVLGGLDRFNSGDIIIKGVSSKGMKQSYFDSYRNTYVGFIFQEYNVLDEFTVGANIALAIELQGRKATDEEINAILRDVDLDGYGARKPNELSGGQKQRVAIARALVKNPHIIMADEPTGALDSVTGKQVLDTLKKLSSNKLVIVVSHDREFAQRYADRIIELSDGSIIDDITYIGECISEANEIVDKQNDEAVDIAEATPAVVTLSEDVSVTRSGIQVREGYMLTIEDLARINEYLASRIDKSSQAKKNADVPNHIGRIAQKTDESCISLVYDGFKLIKSRLPMRFAFKMGANGLKHKKVRLVFTILLSVVAFWMFGVADVLAAYDYHTAATKSIVDSGINYACFTKEILQNPETNNAYWMTTDMAQTDINKIIADTGIELTGVLSNNINVSFEDYLYKSFDDQQYDYYDYFGYGIYSTHATGFVSVTDKAFVASKLSMQVGRLPHNNDEIALTEYICESFIHYGYTDDSSKTKTEILTYSDMLGKQVFNKTVVGVVDTGTDINRYKDAYTYDEYGDTADEIVKYALQMEFNGIVRYSFANVVFMSEDYVSELVASSQMHIVSDYSISGIGNGSDESHVEGDIFFAKADDDLLTKTVWVNGEQEVIGDGIIISEDLAKMLVYGKYIINDDAVFFDRDKDDNINEQKTGVGSDFEIEDDFYEEKDAERLKQKLAEINAYIYAYKDSREFYENYYWGLEGGYSTREPDVNKQVRILGYVPETYYYDRHVVYCSNEIMSCFVANTGSLYSSCVGAMPDGYSAVSRVISYTMSEHNGVMYCINNPASFELEMLSEGFQLVSSVFIWVGVFFALFAAILLAAFISASVANKRREIGILRAIGSRGADVFRIFFSEAFIVAAIEFVLSSVAVAITVAGINESMRANIGLLLTVLNFGIRQIGLLLLISMSVAAIASFIPVWKSARKRPIDAIRDK